MIIRKQQIKTSAEEVALQISFTQADVKKAMQRLYSLLAVAGNHYALNAPLTEPEIIHFLTNDTFAPFAEKYREQLANWAFSMAVRHRFLFSTQDTNETRKIYFLSEKLKCKVGRPSKTCEDWE